METYLERRRGLKNGSIAPDRPKEKKPIPKRSVKMKEVVKDLKKLYTQFLKTRPFCRIKSPVCTKIATAVHHMKGRTPENILKVEHFCECCPGCNLYVEEHPDWAIENGFSLSRLSK